ncbi:MAG: AEC family transporter [Eubacteriales bacterium]|nr:AEC family transporter [Eubacteriales bacterium]
MFSVLSRASCFIAIIILGQILRKTGFFKEEDFHVLSKIVLKITLPAAIVSSFAGTEIAPSMLALSLAGLGGGVLYMVLFFFMNLRSSKEKRAFEVLNSTGYNIGNFTLPFAQSFLGPTGVIVTSLFDTGNAVICLGGAYSVSSMIQGGGKFSIMKIVKKLLSSVPFVTYIIMASLSLLHLNLPEPITSFAGIIGNANAFMAMLMIGVGFKLTGDRAQLGSIVRILSVRYAIALALSLICYFILPFPLEYRQALAILVFSPIASAAPPFTAELKGDIGLSSAINSLSIVISIICIVCVLTIVL